MMPSFIPDGQYIYACIATRFGPGNMIPAFQLGKGHIAHLFILRGAVNADDESHNQWREAVLPARRLQDFAFVELGLPMDCITVLDGDPDSFVGWGNAAARIADVADTLHLPVLLNMQGGTKQTGSGVLYALGERNVEVMPVFYSKYPASPRVIFRDGNALVEGNLDIEAAPLPTKLLIEAAGLNVLDDSACGVDARRMFKSHAEQIDAIADRAFGTRRGNWVYRKDALAIIKLINRANYFYSNEPPFAFSDSISQTTLAGFLDPENAMALFESGLIWDPAAIRLATGGWLEYHVFATVQRAFAGHDRVEVSHSIALKGPRATGEAAEIDVLVRIGDRLHLIEVKTSTGSKRAGEHLGKQMRDLGALKKQIAGAPCQAWIVAPFLTFTEEAGAEWERRGMDEGVTLLNGPAAIARLVDELMALAKD